MSAVDERTYDCLVIGGGPAGLSASLVLARADRRVLLVDANRPRNAATFMAHGFLTRDGIPPHQLRELARAEVTAYDAAEFQWGNVTRVSGADGDFTAEIGGVRGSADRMVRARKIVLATGLRETLANVPNVRGFYGSSLFSCVHCDGWERRGERLVVISEQPEVADLAITVWRWAGELTVLTNGSGAVSPGDARMLAGAGIRVSDERIFDLEGHRGELEAVRLEDGTRVEAVGGFVQSVWSLPPIVTDLVPGAEQHGGAVTDEYGRTAVPGVYAAGDIRGVVPSQLIIAAGDGTRAAVGVNRDLTREEFARSIGDTPDGPRS